MEVTDISTGLFVFTPRPNKPVSYRELSNNIQGAGYEIEEARIEVKGRVSDSEGKTILKVVGSGQGFELISPEALETESGKLQTVFGLWSEEDGRQIIHLADSKGSGGGSKGGR